MADDKTLADQGSRLCLSCGLCCDGALHDAAVLMPEEIPLAMSLGMKVNEVGADVSFQLPCHLLKDRCCTVYADRPSPCRNYKCKLLRSLEAGKASLEECVDKVHTARALLDNLTSNLPPGMTVSAARNATLFQAGENWKDASERAKADVRLHVFALSLHLDKYFRTKTEGAFVTSTVLKKGD